MKQGHWTLDDIPWGQFDANKVNTQLVPLIKAASLVEFNGKDYGRYLCEVFNDDEEFKDIAMKWAEEEVQHGEALRKWAELADPTFDFEGSFNRFVTGYQQVPKEVNASVRGSRCGELIARCIVETGTSSYYTAIKEYTDEPVLKAIAARIAADELRHYKLFYTHMKRYLEKDQLGFWARLKVAFSRIAESEDDELAYAYFAANCSMQDAYDHKLFNRRYVARAYALYRKWHVESMVGMVFKAAGLKPNTWLHRLVSTVMWKFIDWRTQMLAPKYA